MSNNPLAIDEQNRTMGLADRTKFSRKYIHPLLEADIFEQTIPNKPKSQNQKYRLTAKGIALKNSRTSIK